MGSSNPGLNNSEAAQQILPGEGSGIQTNTLEQSDYSSMEGNYYLYIANEGNGGGGGSTIIQLNPLSSTDFATIIGNGFNGPSGIAEDTANTDPILFISDDYNRVYSQNLSGDFNTFSNGFGNPNALYYSQELDKLYIAEAGSQISSLDPGSAIKEILAQNYSNPQAVVINEITETLYFSDFSNHIYEMDLNSSTLPLDFTDSSNSASILASNVAQHTEGGLVINAAGDTLYASDYQTGKVIKIDLASSTQTELVNFASVEARGLALTPDDNSLFITGYNTNEIIEYDLTTDTAYMFADNANSNNLLNGPFGILISEYDYPPFSIEESPSSGDGGYTFTSGVDYVSTNQATDRINPEDYPNASAARNDFLDSMDDFADDVVATTITFESSNGWFDVDGSDASKTHQFLASNDSAYRGRSPYVPESDGRTTLLLNSESGSHNPDADAQGTIRFLNQNIRVDFDLHNVGN
ncbi:MAG: hypothetical protein AB8E87_10985, partial [Prochlorococcus sp.]